MPVSIKIGFNIEKKDKSFRTPVIDYSALLKSRDLRSQSSAKYALNQQARFFNIRNNITESSAS